MLLWIYCLLLSLLRQHFDYLVPADSPIVLEITEIIFSALILNLNQGDF